jgi:periplasmic protein TonB
LSGVPPGAARAPAAARWAALIVLSAAGHLAVLRAAGRLQPIERAPARRENLQVVVIDKPVVPAQAPLTAGTRAPATRPARPRPAPATAPIPPAAPETPPPAVAEAAPPTEQEPPLIAGIGVSSTSSAGSFAVPTGNTLAGQPRSGAGAPTGDTGPAPTPGQALTEEPVFLDNVSAAEVRRYYPEESRKAGIEGVVLALLTISADGRVVKVAVRSDPGHGFGDAAARLARLYRFRPARLDGRPVATQIEFLIRFQLD